MFLVFVEFQWIRGIVASSSRLLVYTMPTVCISNSVIASIALGSTITFEVLILALLGLGCVCVPRCLRRDFVWMCVLCVCCVCVCVCGSDGLGDEVLSAGKVG